MKTYSVCNIYLTFSVIKWPTRLASFAADQNINHQIYRKRTLEQALRIHDKMMKEEKEGVRPLHRPRDWKKEERRKEKRTKKKNWATKGGCIAPIIIPSTPNSELLHSLREVARAEAHPGLKFKIVEKGGRTVKKATRKSNPTSSGGCQGGDCLACKVGRGTGGPCRKSNVVYEIACQLCPDDRQAVYLGETARNLYTRGREHNRNCDKKENESFMIKHQQDRHNGAGAEYRAKVRCSFRDCLSRQIAEGVHIRRCEKEVMNTKAEWHQPALWRVRSELSRE